MPKVKISEWSSTPANNTDIDGINIAEGCAPSGINDAIRELMSQVKDLYSGTTGDAIGVAGGGTGATTAAAALTNLGAQASLVSGTNIKTVNGSSLLGAGDLSVTAADLSITTAKLANLAVTTAKIADANVTTAKIADANVTGAKLENSGVTAGTYGSASDIPVVTVDAKGRVTAASTVAVTSSAPTTTQVLSATAGASAGAVGTYMCGTATIGGSTQTSVGATRSSIFAHADYSSPYKTTYGGTWRCLGNLGSQVTWGGCDGYRTYLWLRIA